MANIHGMDDLASSAHTRELRGWEPTHRTLLEDLEHGDQLVTP